MENHFTEDFVRNNNYQISGDEILKLRNEWISYAETISTYPNIYSGQGIVICAGGFIYVTCAWVNISMLRKFGCELPIELWYEGNEINESMISKFKELNVVCKNCDDYTQSPIKSYAMKPFAILHSSFKEVLFLDADNNSVKDPTYLFEIDEYIEGGTIFWPDVWTTPQNNPIWSITGTDDYNSKEQESGQILINKEKCWKELNLCVYFNMNYDSYYKMLLGDKDTFKFAWLALKTKYYMIPTSVAYCGYMNFMQEFYGMTMVQHDPHGDVLFLHRNLLKWALTKNEEVLWTNIKKMRSNQVKFRPRYLKVNNFNMALVDIEGDTEILSFSDLFGNYELECLSVLKDLRDSKHYAAFLVHVFFVMYRQGFVQNATELFRMERN